MKCQSLFSGKNKKKTQEIICMNCQGLFFFFFFFVLFCFCLFVGGVYGGE